MLKRLAVMAVAAILLPAWADDDPAGTGGTGGGGSTAVDECRA
jgi:hypothetical protein